MEYRNLQTHTSLRWELTCHMGSHNVSTVTQPIKADTWFNKKLR